MVSALQKNAAGSMKETDIDQEDPLKSAAGYEASKVEMGSGDTVENRISDIIKADSPLMQVARTQANQQSNARGTLNSSMATGAAQRAVIEAATPIAAQDAQTSAQFKRDNQSAENAAGQFNAGEVNKARATVYAGEQELEAIDRSAEQDRVTIGVQGEEDRKNIAANIEGESRLQKEREQIDLSLIDAEGNVKLDLLFEQGEIDKELQALALENDLILQDRKAEIDEMLINADGEVKSQLQAEKAEIDKQLEQIRGQLEAQLIEQRGKIDMAIQQSRNSASIRTAQISADSAERLQQMRDENEVKIQMMRDDNALEQLRNRSWVDAALQNARQIHEENMQVLTGEQRLEQERINGQYNALVNSNRDAAQLLTQHNANVANILNNPELDAGQKTSLIAKQNEVVNSSMSIIQANGELDLGDILDFSLPAVDVPESTNPVTIADRGGN